MVDYIQKNEFNFIKNYLIILCFKNIRVFTSVYIKYTKTHILVSQSRKPPTSYHVKMCKTFTKLQQPCKYRGYYCFFFIFLFYNYFSSLSLSLSVASQHRPSNHHRNLALAPMHHNPLQSLIKPNGNSNPSPKPKIKSNR